MVSIMEYSGVQEIADFIHPMLIIDKRLKEYVFYEIAG